MLLCVFLHYLPHPMTPLPSLLLFKPLPRKRVHFVQESSPCKAISPPPPQPHFSTIDSPHPHPGISTPKPTSLLFAGPQVCHSPNPALYHINLLYSKNTQRSIKVLMGKLLKQWRYGSIAWCSQKDCPYLL